MESDTGAHLLHGCRSSREAGAAGLQPPKQGPDATVTLPQGFLGELNGAARVLGLTEGEILGLPAPHETEPNP